MSRSEKPKPNAIPVEDALRGLTAGVGQLDGERAAAYGELSTLRSAKQSSLERREKIYAVKYGAGDRRVVQVQKQRETNTRLQQEIYVAHTQAATPAPTVGKNEYVFHGFVRNRSRQPLARLTVALYDEKGQWLRELGYGCTDENGYFLLRYTRDAKDLREEEKAQKEAEAKAAAAKQAKAAGDTPPPAAPDASAAEAEAKAKGAEEPQKVLQLLRSAKSINTGGQKLESGSRTEYQTGESRGKSAEIRVYDAKQMLLHREDEPLTPALGKIDYREIVIDDEGKRCVPPPGSTDNPPPPAPEKPTRAPRAPAPAAPQRAAAKPPTAPAPREKPAKPEDPAPRERASTPLENIKGVGPKTAAKYRAAGIKDVEALKETETAKLIDLAGMDKNTSSSKPTPRAAKSTAKKKPKK